MEFFNITITKQAIELVNKVLKSGWLNEGKYVEQFENRLESYVGKKPIAVNSCTSALHLALSCESIGIGDEVIVPTQTFIATATAIKQAGATPVFVDVCPQTGNISVQKIEQHINSHTKAIMPVHFGGLPCDIDEINAIAKKYNLVVIEDAAHALTATYKDKYIGTLSDYTCFSFQCIKLLTTGDGGALTTPEHKKDKAIALKWFGINKKQIKTAFNERLPSAMYNGYKYNMNNITAAIGLGNLIGFKSRMKRRKKIACKLYNNIKNIAGIIPTQKTTDRESSYWLFPTMVENRLGFFNKMKEKKIPVKVVNYGIDLEPIFKQTKDQLANRPGQRYFDEHHICLPCHEGLSDEDVNYIIKCIKEGW